MADFAPKVIFEPVAWDHVARSHIARIEGVDAATVDGYGDDIEAGARSLWGVVVDGRRVGTVIVTIEREARGPVVVVDEMFAWPVRGLSLAHEAEKLAEGIGQRVKAVAVRFWTRRAGLVRKMKHFQTSYVMERAL